MTPLSRVALSFPKTSALVLLGISLVAAAGLPRTWTNVGYRVFLGSEHPAVVSLDQFIERFGGGLPIVIAWECGNDLPCEHALSESALLVASEIEQVLLDHLQVRHVISPSSAELFVPGRGSLVIRTLVEEGVVVGDLDGLVDHARADPMWRGTLVSNDGSVGSMIVQLTSTESRAAAEVVPYIRSTLAPYEASGFRFYLAGDPVDFVVSGGQMQADTPRIMVALVAALVVTAWLLLRSWTAVLLSLTTAGLALVWAMGAMAWLGWPEMELTQALRPGILVVGLCNAVHLIARYAALSNRTEAIDGDRAGTVLAAAADVYVPCSLTSLTTGLAFLSFTTSGSAAFVQFGVVASIGVLASFILTFGGLPIALAHLPIRRVGTPSAQRSWGIALERLSLTTQAARRPILIGATVLLVASGFGMRELRVDLDERELIGKESLVARWATFIEDRLHKADTLELIVTSPSGQSILEPASISVLDAISSEVESSPAFGRGRSISTVLSSANRALHDGDDGQFLPGATLQRNAELLFLMELNGSEVGRSWLHGDHQARLSFEADPLSTAERRRELDLLDVRLAESLPQGWTYEFTGPFAVYLAFADVIQRTQLWSFATAFLAITLVLLIHLARETGRLRQAVRWTFVAMTPSVLPVVVTLGAMGFMGVPLDVGTAMVGAVIVGIAVDDSIHLVTALQEARSAHVDDVSAVREAVRKTGQALVTSSVALSVGFFALMLSSWQSIASFGLLSGLAILVALLADLVILPALVVATGGPVGRMGASAERPSGVPERSVRASVATGCLLVVSLTVVAISDTDRTPIHPHAQGCVFRETGSVVPLSTLSPGCALRPGDTKAPSESRSGSPSREGSSDRLAESEAVESYSGHGHEPRRSSVAGTSRELPLTTVLLAFCGGLLVLWRSTAHACLGYAPLSTGLACAAALTLAPADRPEVALSFAIAVGLLAGGLLQLIVSFPGRSRVLEDVPGLWWALALVGGSLGAALHLGNQRHHSIWEIVSWLMLALVVVLLSRVVLQATGGERFGLAARRSRSVLAGFAVLLASGWLLSSSIAVPGPLATMFVALAAPLPVGYSLLRHRQGAPGSFAADQPTELLAVAAIGVALVASVGIETVMPEVVLQLPASIAMVVVGGLVACALLTRHALVAWTSRVTRSTSGSSRDAESVAVVEIESARDIEGISNALARSVGQCVACRGISVAVIRSEELEVVSVLGDHVPSAGVVRGASAALRSSAGVLPMHSEGGVADWRGSRLSDSALSVVLPLRFGESLLGAVFLGHPVGRLEYSAADVTMAERLCRAGGAALHHAMLESALRAAERDSTLRWVGAGLMHSVGKPLSIAARSAELLSMRRGRDAEIRELARIVRIASDEALAGIETLRRFDGREANGADEPTSIEEIVDRSIARAREIHGGRPVIPRIAADSPGVRSGDDVRRVVTNLIDNALLASREADPAPEVRAAGRGGQVVIEVADHGVGMDPALVAKATDPFFTTRRTHGGSGIGLMDAVSTIERLGGRLAIESRLGIGTTVTLSLPCVPTTAVESPLHDREPRVA